MHFRLVAAALTAAFLIGASCQPGWAAPGDSSPVAWFAADKLTGLADGDRLAIWPDAGGQGHNATQAEAAHQPTFVKGAIHGLPAVRFSADKQTRLTFPRPVQDDFTILCVYQSTQGLGSGTDWYGGAGLVDAEMAGTVNDFGLSLSSLGQLLAGVGNPDKSIASESGYNDGKPHLVTMERVESTGALTLYVDGFKADTVVGNTQTLTTSPTLTLGMVQTVSSGLTGDIAEVQVYGTALDDAARQTVENSLKAKYGITVVPRAPLTELPGTAAERTKPVILPPDPKPAIHGPSVVGASPRRPFLFLIPATGQAPLTYAAAPLPGGLRLDPQTGVLSGRMTAPGSFDVQIRVSNAQGTAERALTLVCGDGKIAQTPPMGWSSWNIFANSVTDANIRDAADGLLKTGLAAHGYQYVNLDDSWEGPRDKKTGGILPNRRIGDVKALAEYVHGRGLKFGLYSAPTTQTCSGFLGSLGHETQDAKTYARWGVDYLKYDWCPNDTNRDTDPKDMQAAYGVMGTALLGTDRDIVYAVSTYGKGSPWDWAAKVGGNVWSSNTSFLDTWEWLAKIGFDQRWNASRDSPGHWNDPGLLMVGKIGFGDTHRSHLTPSEQMTQMSMWSLLGAPLMISCDLSQLDPNAFFPSATAILTNDEVLDIDQDPLAKAGYDIRWNSTEQVWARDLADGTVALGLFNLSDEARKVPVRWAELKRVAPQPVRDLWRRQDLGTLADGFIADVPPHGVVLLRVGQPGVKKP